MLTAITRSVSPAIDRCELTTLERMPINLERAADQHRAYEQALHSLGIEVLTLPAEPDLPDSVFVEDTAIVLDECAVITRPGAVTRRPETVSISRSLAPYRELFTIQPPGRLDGGDVLQIGKTLYVGLSSRSDMSALGQLQKFLAPFGYRVCGVPVRGCLHLKSALTRVGEDRLLVNPAWVEKSTFPGFGFIDVDPAEPYSANALWVAGRVIFQPGYPRTLASLEAAQMDLLLVDQSELGKAEGGLTCCSLIFKS